MQRISPSAARLAIVSIFFVTAAGLIGAPAPPASAAYGGSNGKIAFADWDSCDSQTCTAIDIFSMNPNGSGKTLLSAGTPFQFNQAPVWSPDGRSIAFQKRPASDARPDIYTMS